MNVSDFTYLLNKPDAINNSQITDLDKILNEYPYFQSARSLYLKGLYNQDSFKYNSALKSTASYTTDRSILFDFITSEHFIGIQKAFFQEKEDQLFSIPVVDSAVIENESTSQDDIQILEEVKTENTLEKSIISSIKEATQTNEEIQIEEPQETVNVVLEEKLEIGKPLEFKSSETHSFQEWLQLSKLKPILRENQEEENNTLANKYELIDKFIEANPKITPPKEDAPTPSYTQKNEDTSYLMTETLAKIYLEQKKFNKAIQAYEILILKYPEKSSLFADRISDIKELQQNNNK
ncbi:MAG: tetratricopeptide repeat protein [Bacteroidota bacterium]